MNVHVGVVNGPSKVVGVTKRSLNIIGLLFKQLCVSRSLDFFYNAVVKVSFCFFKAKKVPKS